MICQSLEINDHAVHVLACGCKASQFPQQLRRLCSAATFEMPPRSNKRRPPAPKNSVDDSEDDDWGDSVSSTKGAAKGGEPTKSAGAEPKAQSSASAKPSGHLVPYSSQSKAMQPAMKKLCIGLRCDCCQTGPEELLVCCSKSEIAFHVLCVGQHSIFVFHLVRPSA